MSGSEYNFHGCVNRADFPEFEETIDSILRGDADVEHMISLPIYKTRVPSNGEWTTQPRLLFYALPDKGLGYFAVLGVVLGHKYHRSKFIKPDGVLGKFIRKHLKGFLEDAYHLSQTEENNARLIHDIERRPCKKVKYDNRARYYNGQFIIPNSHQGQAAELPSPAVYSGTTGAGKSYLLHEKLQETLLSLPPSAQVLYVSNSADLITDAQLMWGADPRVVYMTYDQLMSTRSSFCSDINKMGEEAWFQWFRDHLRSVSKDFVEQLRRDPEAVYEEFRIISLYARNVEPFSKAHYLKELGRRQSLFPRSDTFGIRDVLYEAYEVYQRHLKKTGKWDPAFYDPKNISPAYYAVMVDEMYDLSLWQLHMLLLLAKKRRIYYAGDTHQRLRDRLSFRPALLNMLRKMVGEGNVFHAQLPGNYRCPNKVIDFTNEVMLLKNVLTGGIADPHEVTSIERSEDPKRDIGDIFHIKSKDDEDLVFRDMFSSEHWAIVAHEHYRQEVIDRYGLGIEEQKRVFTPEKIKGMGFQYIIIYKLMNHSSDLWNQASKQLGGLNQIRMNENLSVEGRGDSRFAPLFNGLIMSISRAMHSAFIVQDDWDNTYRHITNRFARFISPASELGHCLSTIKAKYTSDMTVLHKQAEDLLKNHMRSYAKHLCLNDLQMTEEAYAVFEAEYMPAPLDEIVNVPLIVNALEERSSPATSLSKSRRKNKKKNTVNVSEVVVLTQQPEALLIPVELPTPKVELTETTSSSESLLILNKENAPKLINALLIDFTFEHLTQWFKHEKGKVALAWTFRLPTGDLISLFEMIVSNASFTGIFCDFLERSAASGIYVDLINTLNREIKYSNGTSMVHMAASWNCTPLLKLLLTHSIDMECVDNHCRTPLFFAIYHGNLLAMDLLIKSGAQFCRTYDQKISSEKGRFIPFFVAINYGSSEIVDIIRARANEKGPSPSIPCHRGMAPFSKAALPLFLAAERGDVNAVKRIIQRTPEIDINITTGHDEVTALLIAVQNGHYNVVVELLQAKAEVDQPLKNGGTALLLAAQFGYPKIVECLIQAGANLDPWAEDQCTPLIAATYFCRHSIIKKLIDEGADVHMRTTTRRLTVDHLALVHNDSVVGDLIEQKLIQCSAMVNLMDDFSYENLLTICLKGDGVRSFMRKNPALRADLLDNCLLMSIFKSKNLAGIFCDFLRHDPLGDRLIRTIAQECRFRDGSTPVHVAVLAGCIDFVNLWVMKKLDIDVPDKGGKRPLMEAIYQGHFLMMKILLDAGADVASEVKAWPSPLYAALQSDTHHSHAGIIAELINKRGALSADKVYAHKPLIAAIKNSGSSYVNVLLKHGVDANACNHEGASALYIASKNGFLLIVRSLLFYGANVNSVQYNGMTPLMIAAHEGQVDVALLLIRHGADVTLKTGDGEDVFSFGEREGHWELVIEMREAVEKNLLNRPTTPLIANSMFVSTNHSLPHLHAVDQLRHTILPELPV